ncbi:hypothetical protein K2173_001043 [Erythroxylum novogranatense]|uniref:Pentatricopeptide repeat-containing protein n=1 Tax=Erythroxylum novogranatense TaxID=1862640 RepID=A0AAV8SIC9_9ROSI|nr:hypothetical protein K2173_001043 [Erythroxylum novogranatense]
MHRSGTILAFLRLLTKVSRPPLHGFTQVPHFWPLSPCSVPNQFGRYYVWNIHQKFCFSSKPNLVVDLLSINEWSPELKNELENLSPTVNHEIVVYVLKKLDKDPEKTWDFFTWASQRDGFRASSHLYSLLLRILVRKDSMKKFWIALTKMKEEGFYIDEETYLTILGILKNEKMINDSVALSHFYKRMLQENAMEGVVKNVVNSILEVEWSNEVEQKLRDMGIVLTDNFVIKVTKELRHFPLKALKFFNWIGSCENYEHSTVTYNAFARILGRSDSIEEFWGIIKEMKSAGHDMDIDTYIKISRQFQKSRLMENAVKLYEFMMDGPFKPSVQDCSILLRSISVGDNPNLDLVFRVANKCEAAGIDLSKAVYDGIHRSLTSAGEFDKAEEIIKVMRNAGFEPDNITYSQLIFGFCKARRLEEARKFLDNMEADGCIPDVKTWTVLIQGHFASNQFDQALMSFAKMMERNYTADADLAEVMLNGFLGQKRIDSAYTFLVEMINKIELRPWQSTYKLLIGKLIEVRKLEEAMNLLQLMKKHGYPPFAEPIVQHIAKFGTVEDANSFLKALSVKQCPSVTAYLHVFKSFFQEGRHSEAKDLLYKCPYHVRKHDEICKLFGSVKATRLAVV